MTKKRKIPLHWRIIIGMVLGLVWSILSSYLGWSKFTLTFIKPFGDIFIRLLKMVAVPLVFFSIISGIAGLADIKKLGRVGLKTISIYIITTVIAISLGLGLVNTIKPGKLISPEKKELLLSKMEGAYGQGQKDKISLKEKDAETLKKNGPLSFFVDLIPDNIFGAMSDNLRMLQVIVFALFMGIAMGLIPAEKAKPFKDVVDSINDIILKIVDLIIHYSPFMVFALMAGVIAELAGNEPGLILEIVKALLGYSLTVILGLAILFFGFYPVLVSLFVKGKTYTGFFKAMSPAQSMAFSTSSSAATLPITMDCVRENLGVSNSISSFVLPIGATVNMDGTSLYQGVAAVFLAQFFGVDLSLGAQLTIVFTATLASIGTPAIPSAGLVMLIIVLESVGLPAWWIALIFPVDRILDMCRTTINVTGDAAVCTLVAYSENELIEPVKRDDD